MIKMSCFDVNGCTFRFCKRGMAAITGTSDPCAFWIRSMFIVKYTFKDINFFTTWVHVWIENGVWLPPNQGSPYAVKVMMNIGIFETTFRH